LAALWNLAPKANPSWPRKLTKPISRSRVLKKNQHFHLIDLLIKEEDN
jgi:hypothetical protein